MSAEPADSATAGAVQGRTGVITLARHGEPNLSRKVKLTASEYRAFWARYEVMGIVPGQTPPADLVACIEGCDVLISSTRQRAVESAEAAGRGRAFARHDFLVEAPLPPPPWPGWIRLSPRIWGFFSRFWWWFFNHHEGQETRKQAEARADLAAAELAAIAAGGRDVVVLAHGFFNLMIGRALRRRGWRQTLREGYKYWSTRRFERS